MKVHQILFAAWVVGFIWWAARQFVAYNRRRDDQLKK
jgi:hypothetical protein